MAGGRMGVRTDSTLRTDRRRWRRGVSVWRSPRSGGGDSAHLLWSRRQLDRGRYGQSGRLAGLAEIRKRTPGVLSHADRDAGSHLVARAAPPLWPMGASG